MLDLYKNIKKRRTELEMSQDHLAELTGYTNRSSIAKIEKGEVDLAQSKIELFAKALRTTPQDLIGYDIDHLAPGTSELRLLYYFIESNPEYRELLEMLKDVKPEDIDFIKAMLLKFKDKN